MTARILMGAFPEGGGNYGLRISRPGYDARSNPVDDEQLVFNSDWPAVLPIHLAGSTTLTAGQTTTVSYSDLGYIPHMSALVKRTDPADWQNFVHSNALYVKRVAIISGYSLEYALDELTWDGNLYPKVRMSTFSDHCEIYSSVAIQVVYSIYHIKAFT